MRQYFLEKKRKNTTKQGRAKSAKLRARVFVPKLFVFHGVFNIACESCSCPESYYRVPKQFLYALGNLKIGKKLGVRNLGLIGDEETVKRVFLIECDRLPCYRAGLQSLLSPSSHASGRLSAWKKANASDTIRPIAA